MIEIIIAIAVWLTAITASRSRGSGRTGNHARTFGRTR